MDHSSSRRQALEIDHSLTRVVEYNGRRYTAMRPARRPDNTADVLRNHRGQRVSYQYVLLSTKRARVAASTETIQRLLPEVRAGDASQTECAVCLQDYVAEETIRAMPVCNHAFHLHCISEWLSRSAVCPICRRELPLPTQEEHKQEEGEDDEEDENGVRRSWNWVRVPVSPRRGYNWW